MEGKKKCQVSVGSALLGQPMVRLELQDGSGRAHSFFRRRKNDDGTWTHVEEPPWSVDITDRKIAELVEAGYLVVDLTNEDAPPKRGRGKKEEG